MNKKENLKLKNLPIVNKGKLYKRDDDSNKTNKFITAGIIVFIIMILMLCGYSMAKMMEEVVIQGKAQLAEPILIIENNHQ